MNVFLERNGTRGGRGEEQVVARDGSGVEREEKGESNMKKKDVPPALVQIKHIAILVALL